ncbi:MAG: DNA-processing protein DprA [Leptospiraceae bacterium]|nr:DNA-processing protein DprA [Leptospiraceae bacterium]
METEKRGVKVIDFFHPRYPNLLKEIDKPPILLFCKGNLDLLQWN